MKETKYFINEGFGWECRACRAELAPLAPERHSRFFREGEAESKTSEMTGRALAKWADAARTALVCPRCSIRELIEIG